MRAGVPLPAEGSPFAQGVAGGRLWLYHVHEQPRAFPPWNAPLRLMLCAFKPYTEPKAYSPWPCSVAPPTPSRALACSRAHAPGDPSACVLCSFVCCSLRVLSLPSVSCVLGGSAAGRGAGVSGRLDAAPCPAAWSSCPASPPAVLPPCVVRVPGTLSPGLGGLGSFGPGIAASSRMARAIWRIRSMSTVPRFFSSSTAISWSQRETNRRLSASTASRGGRLARSDLSVPARRFLRLRARSRTVFSVVSNASSGLPSWWSSPAAASWTTRRAGLIPLSRTASAIAARCSLVYFSTNRLMAGIVPRFVGRFAAFQRDGFNECA